MKPRIWLSQKSALKEKVRAIERSIESVHTHVLTKLFKGACSPPNLPTQDIFDLLLMLLGTPAFAFSAHSAKSPDFFYFKTPH